jgi:hypothetical protein
MLLFVATIAAGGCAGGRSNLRFEDTRYPISLSPTVLGSDGGLLLPAQREVVGKLEIETKVYGVMWAAVPLTPNKDLSAKVNDAVARAGGQAVVNLRVTSRQCGLNHAWVISTVPLWPGCSHVFVQGDIIREQARQPTAAPEPAPSPTPTTPVATAHPMIAPAQLTAPTRSR